MPSNAHWTEEQYQDYLKRQGKSAEDAGRALGSKHAQQIADAVTEPAKKKRRAKEPNKTELAYRRQFLDRDPDIVQAVFEPVRFYLPNGHSYRPDWMAVHKDWSISFHEVKGGYIFSRDSRVLFDCAATAFPWFRWFWAQQKRRGEWDRKESVE